MKTNNIEYYNKRANEFISGTKDADLSELRCKFTEKIPARGHILDLGCGSGRDSIAFKEMGFDIHAVDGSEEIVKYCKTILGDNVTCATFEEFESYLKYDGIWACASLIHVERKDLSGIIFKYTKMLNDNGVFFMSFKNGMEDYIKDGRSFTCFTPDSARAFLEETGLFSKLEIFESSDVRPGRSAEKWVNVIAVKSSDNNCITGDDDHLLLRLRNAIKRAKKIDMIVAFLMESGVRVLVEDLQAATKRGAVLRILCGNYLNITQPSALYLLKDYLGESVDLRFYSNKSRSFHPKAYIFEYEDCTEIFVGSSNISLSALTTGIEWNYKIDSITSPKDCRKFKGVFEDLFLNHSIIVNDEEMRNYSKNWKKPQLLQQMVLMEERAEYNAENEEPKPTDAQIEALYELNKSREAGWDKGLVVAATGIGKTYLAAFDSREYSKILFLAHREEILGQAMKTFENVRPGLKVGIFNGNQKDLDCDALFASVQTLGKTEYLSAKHFAPDAFDYMVVDEFHHAVANQYRNILDYFTPKFLLGLTATPERLDNKDVFALCAYNRVYEVRLKEAIQKGWLVPFRYYGVYDETNFGEILYRNGSYDEAELEKALSIGKRADAIFNHYKKYDSKRALGFCSGRKHACYMAGYFRDRGVSSCAVISGVLAEENSTFDVDGLYRDVVMDRKEALEKLKDGSVKIIFSVDMFNEGVDIPALDMVMFLRPTESPTVFLQQLGRGLRWNENKKYLNILDFIGNYKNACLIPAFLASAVVAQGKNINISITTLREELPEECFIDFDLQVIDLFKRMQSSQMSLEKKLFEEYERVEVYIGERPLRLAMYTYMDSDLFLTIKKKNKYNIFKDYLSFLNRIEKILPEERALLNTKAHAFLKNLEETKMSKLYKMPLLLSFIEGDKLVPSVGEKEIAGSFRSFYSHKANAVDLLKDISTQGYAGWGDEDYYKLAVRNPIHFLCESSKEFFSFKDGRFYLSDDLLGFLDNPCFVMHFKDVVEYRVRRFYKERLEGKG